MDLNYLKKITKIFTESGVDEIEIEEEGLKLRIAKNKNSIVTTHSVSAPTSVMPTIQVPTVGEKVTDVKKEIKPEPPKLNLHEIKSPIVGTFYRAPSPDADPYVEVGSSIQKGTVLCIIEAMKLMNKINSEYDGEIVEICVNNEDAVEYDQVIMILKV